MAYTANISTIQNSFYNSLPKTYDYLRPNAFRFSIKDMPNVSFTCQSANIPDLQLQNFRGAVQASGLGIIQLEINVLSQPEKLKSENKVLINIIGTGYDVCVCEVPSLLLDQLN